MSDPLDLGVLYTDHPDLAAGTPFPSLWSYRDAVRTRGFSDPPSVRSCGSGDPPTQYFLHRSDPLLNTILPGTEVSLVVNFGDRWAAGRSLVSTSLLPRIGVFGPFTQPRLLRVGRQVSAVGAVLPSLLARHLFGVPTPELTNRIVPLEDLWPRRDVERLCDRTAGRPLHQGLAEVRDELLQRLHPAAHLPTIEHAAVRVLTARRGRIAIENVADRAGISRQTLARRFHQATGVPPKFFARIVRFQELVHGLLSSDVSRWASVATEAGFYDQAHMINEFRSLAGAPPTVFFQPHDDTIDPARVQVRGRPSEWLR
jgi:AraC-like DNA-binding protein